MKLMYHLTMYKLCSWYRVVSLNYQYCVSQNVSFFLILEKSGSLIFGPLRVHMKMVTSNSNHICENKQ
jgi:hypothetical protein